jgi:hypothetical protein
MPSRGSIKNARPLHSLVTTLFENERVRAETINVFLDGYFSCVAKAMFDLLIKPASTNTLER